MKKPRSLIQCDGYLEVPLTKNRVALIDLVDRHLVEGHSWFFDSGYARVKCEGQMALMHRFILGLPSGRTPEVDHVNGNGIDNRRTNLRICTSSQNQANSKTDGFKGVSWHMGLSQWRAQIVVNYKAIHIGYFDDQREAIQSYNKAAKKYFGSFARLNEIR